MSTYILNTRTDRILDQGKQERDREKIAVMLRNGLNADEVSKYGDYPIDLVNSVKESLKTQEAQEENLAIAN